MFYDKFLNLCSQKGVSATAACVNAGLSESAWKRWVDGGTPNSISMGKLCKYFGVSMQSMYDEKTTPSISEDDGVRARQEAFDNPDFRVLFDAARNVPASKLYEVISQLRKYKEDNNIE